MATTVKKSKAGRKPSTPSKSVKGKMTTKKCSTAGTTLKKSKLKSAKSRAGSYLAGTC
jgi:hypothetical protein